MHLEVLPVDDGSWLHRVHLPGRIAHLRAPGRLGLPEVLCRLGLAPAATPDTPLPSPPPAAANWRAPACPAPDVTVIVRTIGTSREWLEAAVASALEQDGLSVEVLVVDDGAGVPPLEGERLGWLRLPVNLGLAAARNAGVARARGRWIRLLDDDDTLPPGALAAQVAQAEASQAQAVVGPLQPFFDPPGADWADADTFRYQRQELERAWHANGDLGRLVRDHPLSLVPMPTLLWRRGWVPEVPPDFVTADDNAALRLALAADTRSPSPLAWLEREVLSYRMRPGSNSHGGRKEALCEARVAMARQLARHERLAQEARAPKQVAILDWSLPIGGAQWALMITAQQLDRRLVEPIFFVAWDSPAAQWCRTHGIEVARRPLEADYQEWVAAECLRRGIALVDVAWAAHLVTEEVRAAAPECWAHAQSTHLHWAQLDRPEVAGRFDRILAVSQAVLEANPHLADRSVVIPSPVDAVGQREAAAGREAVRAAWGVAPDEQVVLTALRMSAPTKRLDLLIEVMRRCSRRGVRFAVAGTWGDHGPTAAQREVWEPVVAETRAIWLEDLPPWELAPAYAASDIYFSTSEVEGFSLAMLQAAAAGLRLVLTRVGGVGEFLEYGEGLVVEPGDLEGLVSALAEALAQGADQRRAAWVMNRHVAAALYDVRQAARAHALAYWGRPL